MSPEEPDVKRLLAAHRLLKVAPTHALSELNDLADQGSVSAMIHLGRAYDFDSNREVNLALAE